MNSVTIATVLESPILSMPADTVFVAPNNRKASSAMSPESRKTSASSSKNDRTDDFETNLAAIDKQLAELGLDIDADQLDDGPKGEQGAGDDSSENVKVMLRCRPLMKPKEKEACVMVNEPEKYVQINDMRRQFYFDATFGPESDNESVYMKSCRKLVEAAFKGYNCTLFLYGQTGTGKTYTHSSLATNSFSHLFDLIQDSNKQSNFLIRASYYELYNEDIRDLLVSVIIRMQKWSCLCTALIERVYRLSPAAIRFSN